jgi:rhodanese-related sulfurtransferase
LNLIWINPTYLWPGIVGGLIMGIGFILGGYCPGTSLVALSTLKVDGLFYVLGVLFGVFLFGETVESFSIFWNSSYMGRFTLPELFGIPMGYMVLILVLMALFMFWGGEQLERIIGGQDLTKAPKARYVGAGLLVIASATLILIGQPTNQDRWNNIASEKQPLLDERQVQIQPGELLHTMHDHQLKLVMLDVRQEQDFNLYHLADSILLPPSEILSMVPEFQLEPPNTVFVVMSNDELAATEAWKVLVAESVPNVYILEGGINGWLDALAEGDERIWAIDPTGEDQLRYGFNAALGSAYASADPMPNEFELEYEPKIKLELKRGPTGGGCG